MAAVRQIAIIAAMTDPLQAITDLLREEHGIPSARLQPWARLGPDLGVDGDDASELLQRLHEAFGTDFSALEEQWTEFFHVEGTSPRAVLCGLLLLIPSIALTLWVAAAFDLPDAAAPAIGVVTFFASSAGLGRLFPGKPKRPVTIEGLADIVRAGAWPADPAKVR
ncbi:hypothetical protein Q9Q95_03890 [Sphingomonas sp. DG1-23]|uniref:acyl carrier protein n=1 Tax=Sphingomonas sp. DG1-23 TaxID=3068316 RepID=UPI00273EEDFF|nr:hypothetical protein [Sphingomonas sp. DG1-23]MDP5278053.1 hypothetical protein [Sphingomonas sp. DG1-23]